MKIELTILVFLSTIAFAFSSNAGSVLDDDLDNVPNAFDNCTSIANGPADACNQVDSDQDGYGNDCDADYNQDTFVNTDDFALFLSCFVGFSSLAIVDHDCDGFCTVGDFAAFLQGFTSAPPQIGPTGLMCGMSVPCLP
jgi:hypothetical protein